MNVVFEQTARARPIVLTEHQLFELSEIVGREVLADVQRLAAQSYEAKTLGQLMRTLAKILCHQQHEASPACWCAPSLEFKDPQTDVGVWVHNQVQ